ncbi:AAA-ATPase At3g28510-like [Mercurialis annua]|uniref:AAA-ATPase At3g28510-like n=1 Tax=Mercurialis annua TaxID=3986 RepID=UPI00215F59BB|nr:AAA-ATPase At3g28510-like [Mercurialis annua]
MENLKSSVLFMCLWSTYQQLFPSIFQYYIDSIWYKLKNYFNPTMCVKFEEYPDEARFMRNDAFAAIQSYLGSRSTDQVQQLKGELTKKSKSFLFSMDDDEVVLDYFNGVKLKWKSVTIKPNPKSISLYNSVTSKRQYLLKFHPKHRVQVLDQYLNHVVAVGKAATVKNRKRKLYTNNPSDNWWGYRHNLWSHVIFEHPATFETIAMDPTKKTTIMNDLVAFSKEKDFFSKVGRPWKRGYLLYGPPGTGKSSLIAAIANYLDYNIYDIELTAVKDNTELRKLLIDINSKSVIVIEDIDCSLNLTGQRSSGVKDKNNNDPLKDLIGSSGGGGGGDESDSDEKKKGSKVTLSGLLNFIDGLWSASGSERIVIFTTNHKEKLDPALIRQGRMDYHIEMSYCKLEGFKILAQKYLNIDSHVLFGKIGELLDRVDVTPAEVAELLMPVIVPGSDVDCILKSLVEAVEKKGDEVAKQKKAEEEAEGNKRKALKYVLKKLKKLGRV